MKTRTDSIRTFLKVFWIEAQQYRSWINQRAAVNALLVPAPSYAGEVNQVTTSNI